MSRHSIVSLFSGAGGLDLGFELTGRFKVIFANDVLQSSARSYSENFKLRLVACADGQSVEAAPNEVLSCDVSRVDFAGLRGSGADLIVGGPPCQDFSIVRGPSWDRRGIEVRRGRLYAHFVRALAVLQPKMFVFENVPGLVSANDGLAYKVILEDFANLNLRWPEVREVISESDGVAGGIEGYEIAFSGVVDFSRLGVPQKRERLLIIGIRKDLLKNSLLKLWSIRAKLEGALSGRGMLFYKYPLTPLEVFEGKRLDELGDKYREVMKKWEGVWEEVGTQRAVLWKQKVWDRLTFDVVKDYLAANGVQRADRGELEEALSQHERVLKELGYYGRPVYSLSLPDGSTDLPKEDPAVVQRMKRIPPGENHEFVRGTQWEVEGRGISLVYRRIHPLKPAYTVVAYGGGGTHGYHYDRDRATLTLREKARLQTFPDDFLFAGKKTEIRAQIGEAVPPLAAKRLAEALAEVLEELG
jgi:DNA (cytosine-5)-methyltransferase 1